MGKDTIQEILLIKTSLRILGDIHGCHAYACRSRPHTETRLRALFEVISLGPAESRKN